MIRILKIVCITGVFLLTAASVPAWGQDWVASVFPDRTHDFGTVAKGSKLRHSFRITNSTEKEIHIQAYRTKCGCTEVKLGADRIPPGTQTTVEATLDTTNFQGVKASGLTLILDQPVSTEVDLNMNCFIRGDVLMTPGLLEFGQIPRTDSPVRDMTLQYFGGNPDFQITGSQHGSPQLKVKIREQNRGAGQVSYAIHAELNPETNLGFYKDQITLKTNDPASPEIPIFVTAQIQGLLSVSPSIMNLGTVAKGTTVEKTIILRSNLEFKVASAKATKGNASANIVDTDQAKSLHTLKISYKAPDQPGPNHTVLEVTSDIKDEPPAIIQLFANVNP